MVWYFLGEFSTISDGHPYPFYPEVPPPPGFEGWVVRWPPTSNIRELKHQAFSARRRREGLSENGAVPAKNC